MKIGVHTFSTYSVDTEGGTISLDLFDETDQKFTLQMSVEQVGMLVMTLPNLIEVALRRRFRDSTFRYTYATGACTVEQASDPNALIMTMKTTDGFGISFAVSRERARQLSEALSLGAESRLTVTALSSEIRSIRSTFLRANSRSPSTARRGARPASLGISSARCSQMRSFVPPIDA